MKATRDAFGDQLVISAKDNKNILALSADLAKPVKLDKFAKEFPDRFFELGIAENNMMSFSLHSYIGPFLLTVKPASRRALILF